MLDPPSPTIQIIVIVVTNKRHCGVHLHLHHLHKQHRLHLSMSPPCVSLCMLVDALCFIGMRSKLSDCYSYSYAPTYAYAVTREQFITFLRTYVTYATNPRLDQGMIHCHSCLPTIPLYSRFLFDKKILADLKEYELKTVLKFYAPQECQFLVHWDFGGRAWAYLYAGLLHVQVLWAVRHGVWTS